MLLGGAGFAAASVVAAFSTSPEMLIAARALLGIAGATLAPSTLGLISTMFRDARQRSVAIGLWMIGFMGGAAGPVVGGFMLEHFWWGSVFLLGVPAMALLLVIGSLMFFTAQFLQLVAGLTPLQAGFAMLPAALAAIVSFGGAPILGTGVVVGSVPSAKAGSAAAMSETSAEFGYAIGLAVVGSHGALVYRTQLAIAPDVPGELAEGHAKALPALQIRPRNSGPRGTPEWANVPSVASDAPKGTFARPSGRQFSRTPPARSIVRRTNAASGPMISPTRVR
ncbi:MFS transporter [Rhodococcus koreensis]|uniref:MFS transporter n=1 Tax=Rhodococcus koreensis TaxID=99653 RepID=UPI0036DB9A38